jgi:tRNA dimethylallyltransferase
MVRRAAVLLMGPTGAGKSELAERLAALLPVEIVSVDSAQVYRGMDIGTAKPDAATRARIPHHLIDILEPTGNYSAGDFKRDAVAAMEAIWGRQRIPLLVGGTMLYFHALTSGIAELPAADATIRAAIDARAAREGWAVLHDELAGVDPAAAQRIHVNDPQRIQRALEVHRITGRSITSLQQHRMSVFADVDVIEFAIAPRERDVLHTRIRKRFEAMMGGGLLSEVRELYARGDLSAEHPSMRAVGYRQLWRHIAGKSTLNESVEQAVIATRQLAKRQMTWLRKRESARQLDTMNNDVADSVYASLSAMGHAQPERERSSL